MADLNRQGDLDVRIVDPTDQYAAAVLDKDVYRLAVDARLAQDGSYNKRGIFIVKFVMNGSDINMNVDGSSTPVDFVASPPSGKIWYIYSAHLFIEDQVINHQKFGGIGPLSNGVVISVKESGTERTLCPYPIVKNSDFMAFMHDVEIQSSETDILTARCEFLTGGGTAFELKNSTSDFWKVTINDNLSVINGFHFSLNGYEVDE